MSNSGRGFTPYALVVEHDDLARMSMVEILEDVGFRIFGAIDGDAAVAALARWYAFTVLLFTSVQMPGSRDGFALAQETSRYYPHIGIVVASGGVQPRPGDLPIGARFVAKPFSAEMVYAHLQEILPDGDKPKSLKSVKNVTVVEHFGRTRPARATTPCY